MGMILENAMAFGVNEALKRTFPDDAKEDPTKRPDLIKPFMMVSHKFCGVRLICIRMHCVLNIFHVTFTSIQGAITGCCSATGKFNCIVNEMK